MIQPYGIEFNARNNTMPYGIFCELRIQILPNDKMERFMKILDSKSLGKIIRDRRKELGYTQAYISEFTGLSVTFISDVERGKKTAEIEKIIKLLHILGLDLMVEKRG